MSKILFSPVTLSVIVCSGRLTLIPSLDLFDSFEDFISKFSANLNGQYANIQTVVSKDIGKS
jgi:hypothetical protein